jgi:hypothetical protein
MVINEIFPDLYGFIEGLPWKKYSMGHMGHLEFKIPSLKCIEELQKFVDNPSLGEIDSRGRFSVIFQGRRVELLTDESLRLHQSGQSKIQLYGTALCIAGWAALLFLSTNLGLVFLGLGVGCFILTYFADKQIKYEKKLRPLLVVMKSIHTCTLPPYKATLHVFKDREFKHQDNISIPSVSFPGQRQKCYDIFMAIINRDLSRQEENAAVKEYIGAVELYLASRMRAAE